MLLFYSSVTKADNLPKISFEDFIFASNDYKYKEVIVTGAAFNMWVSPSDRRAAMCESVLCKEGVYVKFDEMQTAKFKELFLSCKSNGVRSKDQSYLDTYYCGIGDAVVRVTGMTSTRAQVLEIRITER